MGRYYSGDIEGKFWFGVQSSTDADFFGVEGNEPSYLEYCFEKDDLESVQEGLKQCRKMLRGYKRKIDKFFKDNLGYNDEMLQQAGIPKHLIEWYARLGLGEKIYNCIKEKGYCYFDAEL